MIRTIATIIITATLLVACAPHTSNVDCTQIKYPYWDSLCEESSSSDLTPEPDNKVFPGIGWGVGGNPKNKIPGLHPTANK
jgi:hypothetical protein